MSLSGTLHASRVDRDVNTGRAGFALLDSIQHREVRADRPRQRRWPRPVCVQQPLRDSAPQRRIWCLRLDDLAADIDQAEWCVIVEGGAPSEPIADVACDGASASRTSFPWRMLGISGYSRTTISRETMNRHFRNVNLALFASAALSLALGFSAAQAASDVAEESHFHRGNHGVPAGQRPPRAPLPRSDAAQGDG